METELRMSLKELDRLRVLQKAKDKIISLKRASEELGLTYKQTKRIWKRFREKGPGGLISRKKGMPSNNRISEERKREVLSLIRKNYADYGPTLTREKLEEKHQIKLSKETIRSLMMKDKLWVGKKTKEKRVHARRTRRSRYGELEQIDGSYHDWFEGRAEKCCLLVAVDDATSALTGLKFCKTETTADYLDLLKNYLEEHGRPETFYSDKHSVFRVNNKKRSEGNFTTRFHEVLKSLDIELICAHSPQAKGRVERANGVLQDRLIKELREEGINTIEEGNAHLKKFRKKYNEKFAIEPARQEDAHKELLESQKSEKIFMEREERKLSKNLSFQYKNEIYQITTDCKRRLTGKRVEIYEEKGKVKMVMQDGRELKYEKWKEMSTPARVVGVKELETLWTTVNRKPKRNHPWR